MHRSSFVAGRLRGVHPVECPFYANSRRSANMLDRLRAAFGRDRLRHDFHQPPLGARLSAGGSPLQDANTICEIPLDTRLPDPHNVL